MAAVIPVFKNGLYVDCFALASIISFSSNPSSCIHKGSQGETVLLEEIFNELAAEIVKLKAEIEELKSKMKTQEASKIR